MSLDDWQKAILPSNYPIFWCVLDDRVHMEMPIENAVFVTQAYLKTIESKWSELSNSDRPLKTFLKQMFGTKATVYKFYPTDEQIALFKGIKLYDSLESEKMVDLSKIILQDEKKTRIEHLDDEMLVYNGEEVVLRVKKVRDNA